MIQNIIMLIQRYRRRFVGCRGCCLHGRAAAPRHRRGQKANAALRHDFMQRRALQSCGSGQCNLVSTNEPGSLPVIGSSCGKGGCGGGKK